MLPNKIKSLFKPSSIYHRLRIILLNPYFNKIGKIRMKIKSKGVLIRVVKMIDDYLERQKLLDEIFSFISFIFINAEILFNSKNHKQTTFKLTYKLNIDENIISLEYCIR